MKLKIILFLLIFSVSCNRYNLEGTWIGREVVHEINGESSIKPLNTILEFKGNKFQNKIIGNERVFPRYKYWIKDNRIVPYSVEHPSFEIISVSDTVLILSMPQLGEMKMIYDKQINPAEVLTE